MTFHISIFDLSRKLTDCLIKDVHFHVVCQRFDNSGSLFVGFGDTKNKAYEDSLKPYSHEII